MKLVRFKRNDLKSIGILTEKGIIDIPPAWQGTNPPKSLTEIFKSNYLTKIKKLTESFDFMISAHDVKLLAPIERPGKILALAGNYPQHIQEASLKRGFKLGLSDAQKQTTVPRPFLKPSTTIIGPDDLIPWPDFSKQIDYEIELAVVIGQIAKNIEPKDAANYIAGFTIANDVSARGVTFKAGRTDRPWDEFYDWLTGKWADGFCPIGPYLVTPDEIDDVQNLAMELKVNNQVRQNANTCQMIYPVAAVISFLSHIMTLDPGDMILTGTPAGVGVATGDFLKPGDKIDCSIRGLGKLTSTLGELPEKFYEPLA